MSLINLQRVLKFCTDERFIDSLWNGFEALLGNSLLQLIAAWRKHCEIWQLHPQALKPRGRCSSWQQCGGGIMRFNTIYCWWRFDFLATFLVPLGCEVQVGHFTWKIQSNHFRTAMPWFNVLGAPVSHESKFCRYKIAWLTRARWISITTVCWETSFFSDSEGDESSNTTIPSYLYRDRVVNKDGQK